MVKHLSDEEFRFIRDKANRSIENRAKPPKGECLYSSENGFYYLRSEFGEGNDNSNCNLEEFMKNEEECKPVKEKERYYKEYLKWYLENVPSF